MNGDIDYEWNLYHDMDNRSYEDVETIKKLKAEVELLENKLKVVIEYGLGPEDLKPQDI